MDISSSFALHTGRPMPVIGLGTWQLTDDTTGTVEAALRLGYRMIDTSGDYGTQPGVGEAIGKSHVSRDDVFVVTKVEEDEDAYESTLDGLRELGLDYADLMLIHRPPQEGAGERLWEGLIRARDDGLARDIGVSNYSIRQIDAIVAAGGEVPVVNQIEWTPFGWSQEMFDYCRDRDIRIQAYSPLTRGERLRDETLVAIADEYRRTPAQILIRWNLQRGIAPLPKANDVRHVEENLEVFDFQLRDPDLDRLNALDEKWSSLGRRLQYV